MADIAEKPEEKQTFWGRIVAATPIALTVIATAFAGLSSSEMTQSMYHRSLAAQQQSKAGDQWNFFQAKRIRGTSLETTVELLHGLTTPTAFDPERLAAQCRALEPILDKAGAEAKPARQAAAKLAKLLSDPDSKTTLGYLSQAKIPKAEDVAIDPAMGEAVKAVVQKRADADDIVRKLSAQQIEDAATAAERDAAAFGAVSDTTTASIRGLRSAARELAAGIAALPKSESADDAKNRVHALQVAIQAAALDYEARVYRQEATYNRRVAEIDEVRVRRSGLESDRRRERSKRFFYSMLLAQAGVTIASLALARKSNSLFWFLAALAGAMSVGFTGYVYMTF